MCETSLAKFKEFLISFNHATANLHIFYSFPNKDTVPQNQDYYSSETKMNIVNVDFCQLKPK